MQVSSDNFQSTSLQQFASDSVRENPQARHAANAEEESKVEEAKSQNAVVQQEEQKTATAIKQSQESHDTNDGNGHEGHEHGQSAKSVSQSKQAELNKADEKALFFDSNGQTKKAKPESSAIDIFG